jgi:hypothetical protein
MSNRFHSKFHRQNHHTYSNAYNPDAGHDPIASTEQPFSGDFVLYGALSCHAPLSATAGYFYSNNTALCAIAANKGLHVFNVGNSTTTGIYVYSTGVALSAYSARMGLNVYSMAAGIDVYGTTSAIKSYSPNFGITSYGGVYGGQFYSPARALSAFGGSYGLDVYSNFYGINAKAGLFGANIYSVSRGISAYGGVVGIDVFSPRTGINVRALSAGVVAFSPVVALSSGGGGVNVFNNKVGIFTTPSLTANYNLSVNGDSYFDGDLTVTGDISAYGVFSYFDTQVYTTSALVVDTNTDTNIPAVRITQRGTGNVIQLEDSEYPDSTLFKVTSSGQVVIGTASLSSTLQGNAVCNIITPQRALNFFRYGDNATSGAIYSYKTRGDDYTQHTLLSSDDNILVMSANASDGINSYIEVGRIDIDMDPSGGLPSSTSQPSRIQFSTTTQSTTAVTKRMTIDHAGDLGIGTETPNERLTVVGNISATGSIYANTLTVFDDLNVNGDSTLGDANTDTTIIRGITKIADSSSTNGILFGNNNASYDTNLYRSTTNTLKTDDNLIVDQDLTVNGNITLGSDQSDTITVNAGPINIPNAINSSDAIILGSDVNLYRGSADTLQTDDSLNVGSSLIVNGPLITPVPVTVNAATKTVQTTETSLIFTTTNCTLTLPSGTANIGRWLFVKNVTANSVVSSGATDILPLGSTTPTNVILSATNGRWAWLQYNGTNWIIMAAN